MLIEQLGVSGQHPSAKRIFFSLGMGGFHVCCPRWDPAHPQPLCWVGRGRTGVQRAQSLHTPESWRERRNPGRVQGVLCVEIKGLALPEQQLRGGFKPLGPVSTSISHPGGNSCGSRHGSGEGGREGGMWLWGGRDVALGSPLR